MVSKPEAKEIAGDHVGHLVGGPTTGYSFSASTSYGPGGPYEVTFDVWRGPDERAEPCQFVVEVDDGGMITGSSWG